MSTFANLTTSIYADVFQKNTLILTAIKDITVRQLKELSIFRTLFMEDQASFAISTANPYLGEYADSSTSGFPPDIMEIDTVFYLAGSSSSRYEITRAQMDELRFYDAPRPVSSTSIYPDIWAWFDQKLYVAPKLSSNTTIYIDYFKDATRDTASGNEITSASTTQTNPWFTRGASALRYAVLAEFYAMPGWLDQNRAAAAATQRNAALNQMRDEYNLRKGVQRQAPFCLGVEMTGRYA